MLMDIAIISVYMNIVYHSVLLYSFLANQIENGSYFKLSMAF